MTSQRVIKQLLDQVGELKKRRADLAFDAAYTTLEDMPLLPITSPAAVRAMRTLPVGKHDVFIASYPKSGTTWTQHIVYTLLTAGTKELDHISNYSPFYDVDRSWDLSGRVADLRADVRARHQELGWRVFNTHLRWDMMPGGAGAEYSTAAGRSAQNCRYIYLTRNGRDVCTSFYHHFSVVTCSWIVICGRRIVI